MMINKLFRRPAENRKLVSVLIALTLAGCATEPGTLPIPLYGKSEPAAGDKTALKEAEKSGRDQLSVSATPLPPAPVRLSTVKPEAPASTKAEAADITLMFDQIPLPTFIQISFGTILKKNFSIDPQIATRTDLVTLRTGSLQTPSQVLSTVTMLLKTYGIAVTELGGFYRIAPDSNLSAYAPEIRRGRAQPDVPLPLRPVYQLVELTSVRAAEVSTTLRSMFGQKINIQDDTQRNAMLLSGQSSDITAALEATQVLDQPLMRGRSSRRISPNSMSADELANKLVSILTAEGYAAATNLLNNPPIVLIPIPASNSVIVFAGDPAVLEHVVAWAKQLDADNNGRRSGGYFTYPVKYADAQDLAKTMQDLLGSAPVAATTPGAAAPARPTGKIVVNTATNTLIFLSSQDEYAQLLGILKELDQPAKSALIEVTVAEVLVSDTAKLGIEWDLNPAARGNGTIIGNGSTVGAGGLKLNFLNNAGIFRASLNALATNKRASILSTPRIMARNGETATIQVGQEVPIITSQQSNANTAIGGTTGGILQTIQYRNTGVILKVKPVIHAGSRIELDVSQEVSSASATDTGVNSSPTISSRKIETKLSVTDGATVLMGGLMSNNVTRNNTGVPFLKDIPVLGQVFGTDTDSGDKTELIVLITPYVINDDQVAEQVTQAFRGQLGSWAQTAPGPAPKLKLVAPALSQENPPIPLKMETQMTPATPPAPVSEPAPEPVPQPADIAPPAAAQPGSLPATGAQVTDPALLEELRKASSGKSAPVKVAPKQPKKNPG